LRRQLTESQHNANIQALHNKHRHACREHGNGRDGHDNPTQARTRLSLQMRLNLSTGKRLDGNRSAGGD